MVSHHLRTLKGCPPLTHVQPSTLTMKRQQHSLWHKRTYLPNATAKLARHAFEENVSWRHFTLVNWAKNFGLKPQCVLQFLEEKISNLFFDSHHTILTPRRGFQIENNVEKRGVGIVFVCVFLNLQETWRLSCLAIGILLSCRGPPATTSLRPVGDLTRQRVDGARGVLDGFSNKMLTMVHLIRQTKTCPNVRKLNFKFWPRNSKFTFRAETKLQTSHRKLNFKFCI